MSFKLDNKNIFINNKLIYTLNNIKDFYVLENIIINNKLINVIFLTKDKEYKVLNIKFHNINEIILINIKYLWNISINLYIKKLIINKCNIINIHCNNIDIIKCQDIKTKYDVNSNAIFIIDDNYFEDFYDNFIDKYLNIIKLSIYNKIKLLNN